MQGRPSSKIINAIIVLAFLGLCIGIIYFRFVKDSSDPSSPDGSPDGSPQPAGNAVTINFYTSDGKKDWVEDVTKEFNAKQVEVDGRPIFVKLEHIRSGESYRKIMDGDADERPTIWGPASRSWLDLINKRWGNLKGGEFATGIRPTVKIALVIAMWEPMARALGYPDKPIGWGDIVRVATQPGGWSNYGHPEWGQFRFGHAHPDYSTSAMLSVISATYAAAGKTSGLSAADLQNPSVVNSVGALERAIVHYGESSSWLIEKLCTRGPGYLSAVPVYESSVISANTKFPNKPFKLVAVYPKEGTFWESHPAGIVQADWVTEEQKKAAQVYLDFLLATKQQAKTYSYGFRPAIDGLSPVSPFDVAHGVDPQAPQRELEDVSEEVFQRANELWHKVKKKATIIMLLDVSGSMQGQALEQAKRGAELFVKRMERDDEIQVIVFGSQANPLNDLGKISAVGEPLVGRLRELYAQGNTVLYDAMKAALEAINSQRSSRSEPRLYGIVCLSDGKDTASRSSKSDIFALLPRGEDAEGTKVFTIAYGGEADAPLLTEIANQSNGRMFKGSEADIEKIYQSIAHYF